MQRDYSPRGASHFAHGVKFTPPLRCFAHAGPRLSRPHAFVAVRGLGRKLFGRSFERPTQFCRQKHAGVHERLVRSTQHSVSTGAVQNAYPSSHSADGVQ